MSSVEEDEEKERDERREYEYESEYEIDEEEERGEDEDEDEVENSDSEAEEENENEEEELLFNALNRIREYEEANEANEANNNETDPDDDGNHETTNDEFVPYQNALNSGLIVNINYTDFNNMYDIYNIHASNEQLYRERDEATNANRLLCPICDERYDIDHMTSHIIYHHYDLYISLNMIVNPSLTVEDIHNNINIINNINSSQLLSSIVSRNEALNTARRLMFSDDDYTPSYEDLLSLCEQIGYHKSGIKNIDIDVPYLDKEDCKHLVKEDDTCRICLECLNLTETLRKTKKCNHIFCSPCIEKWLEENKSCPLCNAELSTEDENNNDTITNTNTANQNNQTNLDSLD